jgi:hypothetical protein
MWANTSSGPLDWQFGVLVLFIAFAFAMLLVPVPKAQRPSAPTQDTTKTLRLP